VRIGPPISFLSRNDIDSSLAGAESPVAAPWLGVTGDRFLAAGLGLQARISRRVSLEFDLVGARSEGDIAVTSDTRGGPFPTLETDLWNLRLGVDYRITEQWGVKFRLEHEDQYSSDWALDSLGADGIGSILSFGAESPDYRVSVLRLQASYRF